MKRLAFALLLLSGAAHADDELFTPVSHHQVAVSATEAVSGAMSNGTDRLRMVCTAACWVATATTNLTTTASAPTYLPAGIPVFLRKVPGGDVYVRVVGASGTLEITEASR